MKKTLILFIFGLVFVMSACGKDKSDNVSTSVNTITDQKGNVIETVTVNPNEPQPIQTTKSSTSLNTGTIARAWDDNSDKKTNKKTVTKTNKTAATSSYLYELRIKYKSLADLKKKVSEYKTLDDILKSDGNGDNNTVCMNPFRQENLKMIFEDKKVYVPMVPKGYKYKSSYLCSRNFFNFDFTDSKNKVYSLKIYTLLDNSAQKTSKYTLSFTSKQGTDIYRNSDGNYCWFLDEKYVVVFSGKDKGFINNLYFDTVYINE